MSRLKIKQNPKKILEKNGHSLYPYQETGLSWLKKTEYKLKGGLLCDEMGLGKTIQMISLMITNEVNKTLIVMPKSLITQWLTEIKKFVGDYFDVLVHHGSNRITNSKELDNRKKPIIVLTTYGLVINRGIRHMCSNCGLVSSMVKNKCGHKICLDCESSSLCSKCFDEVDNVLQQISWDRIILEECHNIRNKKSKIFKYTNKLKSNYRWGITGTPVHNSIKDFISLCRFLKLNKTINLKTIDGIVSDIILRRTKKDVKIYNEKLKIPNLTVEVHKVLFQSEKELDFYKKIKGDIKKELAILRQFDDFNMVKILEMILRLRQSCIMPQLVIDGYKKKWNRDFPDWTGTNSKLDKLIKNIVNERCIVFCNYKKEMKYIHDKLVDYNVKVDIINGGKSLEERGQTLENCNINNQDDSNYIQVLLIQINAGGTGLNLQMFNNIWFTSPSWNPALEFQAIARCHRIGQKKNVKVKKLVMYNKIGTVDDRIMMVQEDKKEIITQILKDESFPKQKFKFTMRKVKSLLR